MHFKVRGSVMTRKEMERKLLNRCDSSGGIDSCWNWMRGKSRAGYGKTRLNGKPEAAHRAMWIVTKGHIPKGLMVCHTCDNPSCVNPSHLFLGTAKDNMDDMKRKGRARRVRGQWGEMHWSAKLSEKDVVEIRKLAGQGVRTKIISERFGVCAIQIRAIVRRVYWNHVV